MRYTVSTEGVLHADDAGTLLAPEDLEALLDAVFAELEALGVMDPDMSARLSTGEISLGLDIDAADDSAALREGGGTLRAALHAAGIATPDWTDGQVALQVEPTGTLQQGRTVVEPQRERGGDLIDA